VQAHGAHVVVRQGLHSVQHLQVNVASAVLGNPSIAKTAATAPAAGNQRSAGEWDPIERRVDSDYQKCRHR
jgi:hypothetical protein